MTKHINFDIRSSHYFVESSNFDVKSIVSDVDTRYSIDESDIECIVSDAKNTISLRLKVVNFQECSFHNRSIVILNLEIVILLKFGVYSSGNII